MTILPWPSSLPQALDSDAYQETPPDLTVSSDTDSGPAKRRRRFSAGVTAIKGSIKPLTKEQAGTLVSFYLDDLQSVLRFSWVHPRTGAAAEFRFRAPPEISSRGATYIAALDLEILP